MNGEAPLQPLPSKRRKVSIEIYFVLYLSAIILLLGTTPSQRSSREDELEELIQELVGSDFRIKVEKAALLYSFIPAGVQLDTSNVYLRRDSINVISAYGTFDDLSFRIVAIEDSATGKAIPAERATIVKRSDRTAIVRWNAVTSDGTGVYRVTVAGSAVPLPPASLRGDLRDKVAEILRRRGTVSDSVTFMVNIFAVSDQAMLHRVTRLQLTKPNADTGIFANLDTIPAGSAGGGALAFVGQPFELTSSNPILPVPPGKTWSNRVSLAGNASTEELDISVNGGDARVVERTASFIVVSGTAPVGGTQEVTVTGRRRSDGRTVMAAFTVKAAPMAPPKLPDGDLYAGQNYRLDFEPQGIPAERIAVEVIENGKTIIARSESRSIFTYQPSEAGKVRFVRYLDNQQVDVSEKDIVPVPAPHAGQARQQGADEVTIVTRAFGVVNGQPNRAVLKITRGNADDPEQVDTKYDSDSKETRQTWRVRRRSKGEDFTFWYYAIDQRGSKLGKSKETSFSAR